MVSVTTVHNMLVKFMRLNHAGKPIKDYGRVSHFGSKVQIIFRKNNPGTKMKIGKKMKGRHVHIVYVRNEVQ